MCFSAGHRCYGRVHMTPVDIGDALIQILKIKFKLKQGHAILFLGSLLEYFLKEFVGY